MADMMGYLYPMAVYIPYVFEYMRFMLSFSRRYPELYSKYKESIKMPEIGQERVSVNSDVILKQNTVVILRNIITEYYIPLNN